MSYSIEIATTVLHVALYPQDQALDREAQADLLYETLNYMEVTECQKAELYAFLAEALPGVSAQDAFAVIRKYVARVLYR